VIGILGADNLIHRRPIGQADRQLLMLYASALGHLCSRLRADESLRQSEEKYRQVFTTETDALVLVDTQTRRYIDVNQSACRLYGYSREEFLRLKQVEVSAEPEVSVRSLAELERKKSLFVPLRYHRKRDGTVFPVEISAHTFVLRGRRMLCAAIRDVTERRQAQEALRGARSKLAGAREEERRRLSRELHDSLAQKLVATSIKLKTFAEQSSASLSDWQVASLGELSRELQDVFGDVRYVSRTLYPPTLEPFGLCTALKQLGSDLQSRLTIVRVRCGPSLADTRFQLETEIELFRIAQEAVSNALRHGRPGRIDLSLRYAKGLLRLTVVDDGKGFDAKKTFRRGSAPKGLGLISMRERAEEIGGTLRITSRPGQTRVEVRARAEKRSPASNA
jgi:PAS domain S-box-containing protein